MKKRKFDFILFRLAVNEGTFYGRMDEDGEGNFPVCPKCGGFLDFEGSSLKAFEEDPKLICEICGREWFVEVLEEEDYFDVYEKVAKGTPIEDLF